MHHPPDPIASAFLAGAIIGLKRRAARQAKLSADGTTLGERGAVILTGEAAVALRLAETLATLADEIEAEAYERALAGPGERRIAGGGANG